MDAMRQWELIGITDADPEPERLLGWPGDEPEVRGTFFWSTDLDLRFRTVSDEAGEALGLDPRLWEGEDLLAMFGIEGTNLAILEAHTAALGGDEGRFTIDGLLGAIRCRVAPTHAFDGQVIGTFCLAMPQDEEPVTRRLAVAVAA
jgi:PAS domain-containing protein